MAISKVVYGGRTLIDLTGDTIKKEHVLKDYTFHGADGEPQSGTCPYDADTQDANAADSEILKDKTAYVKGVKKTGTMPNNGAQKITISSKDDAPKISQGYHDGSGYAGISETEKAKLIADNIRQGVTILGVEGTMSGTEGANPQAKTVTPSTEQQEVIPDEGYNYLSMVTVLAIPYEETDNSAGGKTVTIG